MHVDLNLLIALDALLEENSVAGAADRLRLSHPAMSRTLGRIRRATGDDILVRSGRTMTPTPRALELRDETRELVRRATAVLTPAQTLHLDTLDRVFTIRGHDALAGALALPLTTAIGSSAPNVRIRLLAEPSADVADLARGHTDLEIGATSPARPEIAAKTIGTDHMVTVFRAGHPLAEAVAERGLHRQVVAALPTTSAALDLVAATDLLTVVAEQVCRPLRTRLGLHSRRPPFDLPPVPVILTWHHRNDTDPAHAWLRAQVRSALRGILGSSASGALSSTAAASTTL